MIKSAIILTTIYGMVYNLLSIGALILFIINLWNEKKQGEHADEDDEDSISYKDVYMLNLVAIFPLISVISINFVMLYVNMKIIGGYERYYHRIHQHIISTNTHNLSITDIEREYTYARIHLLTIRRLSSSYPYIYFTNIVTYVFTIFMAIAYMASSNVPSLIWYVDLRKNPWLYAPHSVLLFIWRDGMTLCILLWAINQICTKYECKLVESSSIMDDLERQGAGEGAGEGAGVDMEYIPAE